MAPDRVLAGLLLILVEAHLRQVSAGDAKCGGRLWCVPQSSGQPTLSLAYYHYSPDSNSCLQVDPGCIPDSNCSFPSAEECQNSCITERSQKIGGCESTRYGCCGDGVTANDGYNNCPGEAESTASDGQSSGSVHWGLVASGVCGIVLLLGLVAVVGLSMYAYRQRHRNRHRWYIHEVLQMYDGNDTDSDASSDSSWDDPEHKNLFDRL